jgi:hypothetical protein
MAAICVFANTGTRYDFNALPLLHIAPDEATQIPLFFLVGHEDICTCRRVLAGSAKLMEGLCTKGRRDKGHARRVRRPI